MRLSSGSFRTDVPLAGEVGYSACKDGNAGDPCPFYLGSMTGSATGTPVSVDLSCADRTTDQRRIDALTISLSQPAWGIDQQGTIDKGFPPGSLRVDVALTVDGVPTFVRRANESVALLEAQPRDPDHFRLTADIVVTTVPCGTNSTAMLTAQLDLFENDQYLDEPPEATITMPSEVFCLGQSEPLTANVSDVDGDLSTTRWMVDGVLMSPSTSSIPFTGPHTIEVRATDARGGTTTDRKEVTCTPI